MIRSKPTRSSARVDLRLALVLMFTLSRVGSAQGVDPASYVLIHPNSAISSATKTALRTILEEEGPGAGLDPANASNCKIEIYVLPDSFDSLDTLGGGSGVTEVSRNPSTNVVSHGALGVFLYPDKIDKTSGITDRDSPAWAAAARAIIRHELLHLCYDKSNGLPCSGNTPLPPPQGTQGALDEELRAKCEELAILSETIAELCDLAKDSNCQYQALETELATLNAELQVLLNANPQDPPAIGAKQMEVADKTQELADEAKILAAYCSLHKEILKKFNTKDNKDKLMQCHANGFAPGTDPNCMLTLPPTPSSGNQIFPACGCCAVPPDCGSCP